MSTNSDLRIINITPNCSGEGLKEELERRAKSHGFNIGSFVSFIYEFATKNKTLYKGEVRNPRAKPGHHITTSVSLEIKNNLGDWSKKRKTPRGLLCCYIIEFTLENDNILSKITDELGNN